MTIEKSFKVCDVKFTIRDGRIAVMDVFNKHKKYPCGFEFYREDTPYAELKATYPVVEPRRWHSMELSESDSALAAKVFKRGVVKCKAWVFTPYGDSMTLEHDILEMSEPKPEKKQTQKLYADIER